MMSAQEITEALLRVDRDRCRTVVVSGGEPSLQWDEDLAELLRASEFTVHFESNGTRMLKAPVDWLAVSPKPRFHGPNEELAPDLVPSEIKVVVDDSVDAAVLAGYEQLYSTEFRTLQPCWGADYERSLERTLQLLGQRPGWRLGLQLHKLIGAP
jgi:7-carboxy-7-deazaguanine synthase